MAFGKEFSNFFLKKSEFNRTIKITTLTTEKKEESIKKGGWENLRKKML